jgi:hypothetical protein
LKIDPLSTISRIASLIDITARTSSQLLGLIAEWKDAPKQVHFLSEEISMSRQIAQQLKYLCHTLEEENCSRVQGFTEAIITRLNRAKPVRAELEEILKSVRDPVPSKIHKERWLRKAKRVVSLQGKLREIRFSTLETLGIYNS